MAKKFRGSSVKRGNLIEMYGVSDLLKKIENAGGKVDEAIKRAVDKSLDIVGTDMQTFMGGHKDSGDTYESYEKVSATSDGNTVKGNVGYNIKKGGLPAIFLDVGTPTRKGYFYRYYAVENNRKRIEEIQRSELNEILKELTK